MNVAIFEKLHCLTTDFNRSVSHHFLEGHLYGIEVVLSEPEINRSINKEKLSKLKKNLNPFSCSAHLPFYDLNIGSTDQHIKEYSIKTILTCPI